MQKQEGQRNPQIDEPPFMKTPAKQPPPKMFTSSSSLVRNFSLAPLFAFIVLIFSPSKQVEQKKTKPEQQQSYKALLDESEQNLSRIKVYYPTSSQSVRTFTLALLKYIGTITDGPSNIDCDMIELLCRMKNALSKHEDVLHELTALCYGELDERKRCSLSDAVERGVKTNAIIVKFIWDCCHDGHPRGLLKHRLKTAFFSDQIERATDGQQSVIYAYKVANGDALLY